MGSVLGQLSARASKALLLVGLVASTSGVVACSSAPMEGEFDEPVGTTSEALSLNLVATIDDQASTARTSINGGSTYICAGQTGSQGARYAMVKFDPASIPAGAVISNAALRLHHRACKDINTNSSCANVENTLTVHRITANWSESAVNSGRCSGDNDAGGTGGSIAHVAAATASEPVGGTGYYRFEDVKSDVNAWIIGAGNPGGAANYGWLIKGSTTAGNMKLFHSSEYVPVPVTDPGSTLYRPTLEITYTMGLGRSCSANTDCSTGHCTNGVCCNVAACTASDQCHNAGTCQAYNQASPGNCTNPAKPNGTACTDPNPSNPCDVGRCQSGTCTQTAANTGAQCRPAGGECDVAEFCQTNQVNCPADTKRPNGFACTDDGLPCSTDLCNGSSNFCQHAAGNAGTICNASAGVCDVAETCTGSSTACPANVFRPNTFECRAASCANGPPAVATLPANCTGSSAACPSLQTLNCPSNLCAGNFCSGGCTIDSQCQSGNYCDAGTCTPKQDDGKACTGGNQCTSGNCIDGVCCNTACGNGSTTDCQSCNQAGREGSCRPLPSNTTCRGSAGVCDVAEVCNGSSTACPADAFRSSSTQCRAASCANGTATQAANCTGSSPACPGVTTNQCSPYLCSGTACGSNCSSDSNCITGYFCGGSTCQPKRSNGAACTAANQCTSGQCVDGVCCNSACTGQCQACDSPNAGTCSPVTGAPHGTRPACATDGTLCGGTCNGTLTTACAYPGGSTECRGWDCSMSNEATLQAFCNGAGACPATQTQQCDPFLCGPTGCFGPCTSDIECLDGKYCSAGMCVDKLSNGTTCAAGNQCSSGHCIDGVCCDGTCNGQCEACDVSGKEGTCSAVTGDPHGARPACNTDGSQCGGTCNGATRFTCEYPGAGVRCRDASCAADVATVAAFCTGAGTCPPEVRQDCAPFQCGATQCAGDCSIDANCNLGQVCVAGVCRDPALNGTACASGKECISGQCVDGFCCNSACNGQCEACDVSGQEGACTPVSGAPHGTRPACSSDGSACAGVCNGTDGASCFYAGNEVECRAPSCAAGIATLPGKCIGTGSCSGLQQQACTPFACSGTKCNGNCTTDAQCGASEFCAGGVCRGKSNLGDVCTADNECLGGFCTDGVCCAERCDGQCQSCNEPAAAGACQVIVGAPRGGRQACSGFGPCASTCIGDQADACQFPDSSTECGVGTCSNGVSTNPATCNGGGTCLPPTEGVCEPYVCDSFGERCLTECSSNADCKTGFECEGNACVVPGTGGAGGGSNGGSAGAGGGSSGGTAGTNSSGGSGNTGGTDGDAGPDAGTGKSGGSSDDGGCGCRTPGNTRSDSNGLSLVSGLLVVGFAWQRRRRYGRR